MHTRISLITWASCLFVLAFLPSTLCAQQDSSNIRQKILESEETEQLLIQRTRNFILNKLKAGNTDEAYQAYIYATEELESESIRPFWISEKLLLGYWFGQYGLLYSADSIESSMKDPFHPSVPSLDPERDRLSLELTTLSKRHRAALLQRVASLVSDREKSDFLVLHFDWLTFNAREPEMNGKEIQDYLERDLTPRAEEFLAEYKDSHLRPFVQRHFRYVYVLNDWGYGYYLGMGSLGPVGVSERYLKPEVTLGLGGDVSWKSVLMNAGFDLGIPVSVRREFVHDGKTWNTDVRHNYLGLYATFGLVIEESNMFKLSPHIGIGSMNISAAEADKGKPGGDVSMTQGMMQYGLACDIKFGSSGSSLKEDSHTYGGARVALDYLQFLGNNPIMSGGMLRLNVSWVGFGRPILRDM